MERRALLEEQEALKARQEGRWQEAIARYGVAWELQKKPRYICERGWIEAAHGRAREAMQSLTTCLRMLNKDDRPVIGPRVEEAMAGVRPRVGALTLEANVSGAEVVVDGKRFGKFPLLDPIFLDPGSHAVEVKAPGYRSDERVAVLRAGASMVMRMRLEPLRVEVAPEPAERAPLEPKPEEAKSPSPEPVPKAAIEAPKPLRAPAKAAQPPREPARAAVILTGLGLSIGGAVAGTASLMAAGAARDDAQTLARALAENSRPCTHTTPDACKDVDAAVNKVMAFTAVGVGGIATSALGGALIIYELVRSAPQEPETSTRIAVTATPGGGALKVAGSF
jgi:hypothetical protein